MSEESSTTPTPAAEAPPVTAPAAPEAPAAPTHDDLTGMSSKAQERIAAVIAREKAAVARAEAAEAAQRAAESRAAEAQKAAAAADELRQQVADAQKRAETETAERAVDKAIYRAGITDDEGADFVRLAYGRIPLDDKGARPPLAEWLANRDGLPKAVRAYLPEAASPPAATAAPAAPAATAATAAPATPASPPGLPNPDKGAGAAPPGAGAYDAAAILQLGQDPAAWAAHRAAVFASIDGARGN